MKKFVLRPTYFAVLIFFTALIFIVDSITADSMNYALDFVGYGGSFKYHQLELFGIPAYFALMILGYITCLIFSYNKRKQYQIGKLFAFLFPTAFLVISFIGGKLLYIAENYESVAKNGIGFDGLSLFGAIMIIPLAALIATRLLKLKYGKLMDFCTPFGLILLTFTRSGCFINGCCGGKILWYNNLPLILPVQLFEVVFDLLILELCLYTEKKFFEKGFMYPVFLLSYGFVRFLIEFFRNSKATVSVFTNGQILSLICFVFGIILLLVTRRLNCKQNGITLL